MQLSNKLNNHNSTEKKNIWEKINILLPNFNKLIIALVIAYIGNKYTIFQKALQEKESNVRLYSQLISSRETSESNQRTIMLKPLLKQLTENINNNSNEKTKEYIKEKLLNLEMLVSNFHDSIQLKPLFEYVQDSIKNTANLKEHKKLFFMNKLENIALNITQKQQAILENVGQKFDQDLDLNLSERSNIKIQSYRNTIKLNNTKYHIEIICLNKDVKQKRIQLQITILDNINKNNKLDTILWVSYFDFPMINNLYLSNNIRCAITLRNINNIFATITVIFFPESYSSLKEKTYYEDIIKNLIKK